MPELPEVETVRRTLEPAVGARILGVWDSGMGLHMARKPPRAALKKLVGTKITAVRRIGKYLLVDTSGDKSLLVHLGMTGRLRIQNKREPRATHTHVVLDLGAPASGAAASSKKRKGEREALELRFSDARRFGQVDVVTRATERLHPALAVLGPDPITDGIDVAAFFARSRKKKAQLKAFVLDQSVLAGVGNIYASEALWRAQLKPTARAYRLTSESAARLASAIREVLEHALTKGGTSLRDFVDADGREGENVDYLWVYGRAGEPCLRCKTPIRRSVVQGRATFFCPTCQAR